MKNTTLFSRWIGAFCGILMLCAAAPQPAQVTGYLYPTRKTGCLVYEYPEGKISYALKKRIDGILLDYHSKTGRQIAVVILETLDGRCSVEAYAHELSERWGIATQASDDQSMLIVVYADDQKATIVRGGGLEDVLPRYALDHIIKRVLLQRAFYEDNDGRIGHFNVERGIAETIDMLKEAASGQVPAPEIVNPSITRVDILQWTGILLIVFFMLAITWIMWETRFDKPVPIAPDEDFSDIAYWLEKDRRERLSAKNSRAEQDRPAGPLAIE